MKDGAGKAFGRSSSGEKHEALQAEQAALRARRSQGAGLAAMHFVKRMKSAVRLPLPGPKGEVSQEVRPRCEDAQEVQPEAPSMDALEA